MGRFISSIFAIALLTSLSGAAHAQEIELQGPLQASPDDRPHICRTNRPSRPDGPLSIEMLDGGLGVARRACPRTSLSLGADAYLVADTPNFYGNIRVNALLAGSWAPTPSTEIFVSLEAFRFHTVISSLSAAETGTGYSSVGFIQQLWRTDRLVLALSSKLVLPTASALDQNSAPLAMDVGATFEAALHRTVNVHAALMLLGSVGLSAGPADPRGGVRLLGGLDWHPATWFGLVLELQAGFGYLDAVDLVAVSLGFRFAIRDHFGIELAALYPFVGAERALLMGALNLSWRF